MDAKIFFNQEGVVVSNSRFTANGQTYAIQDIDTVELRIIKPRFDYAILYLLIGFLLLSEEGTLFAVGGLSILLGIVAAVSAKRMYAVVLHNPDAHIQAFMHADSFFAEKVIHALDAAKVGRTDTEDTLSTMTGTSNPYGFRIKL